MVHVLCGPTCGGAGTTDQPVSGGGGYGGELLRVFMITDFGDSCCMGYVNTLVCTQ